MLLAEAVVYFYSLHISVININAFNIPIVASFVTQTLLALRQ